MNQEFIYTTSDLLNNYKNQEAKVKENIELFKKENPIVGKNDAAEIGNEKTSDFLFTENSYQQKEEKSLAEEEAVQKTEEATEEIDSFGNKLKGASGDIISMGAQTYNDFSNVSGSEKESWAQTAKSAGQGAKIGMQFGGPWGAAAGAVAGASLGVIDMVGDTKKRNQAKRDNYENELQEKSNKREQLYRIEEGEKTLKKLQAKTRAQAGYLNLNY